MDGVLSLRWIKFFDAQTKEKAGGEYRRLFVDNHVSHCTVEFLRYARANKIIVVGYPLHCTHHLQGLDVVCFARLKILWGEEQDRIEKEEAVRVTKTNFIVVYGRVRAKAFTTDLVKKAFEKTGIHPWNPKVITPEMMAPSKAHSTEAGAPLPLPSPIHAIRNAVLRIADPHPATPTRSPQNPSTTRQWIQDPTKEDGLETLLDTPIQFCALNIVQGLRKTSAAPLVTAGVKGFSSSMPIPALALSSLRISDAEPSPLPLDPLRFPSPPIGTAPPSLDPPSHSIVALGNNAQPPIQPSRSPTKAKLKARIKSLENQVVAYEAHILLQDLYCTKMQKKLYGKEQKKRSKREVLNDKGKHEYTSEEYMNAIEEDLAEKARLEQLAKEKLTWQKKETEERLEAKAEAIGRWQDELTDYKERGAKRPLKPKPIKRCPTPKRFAELKKSKKKKQNDVLEFLDAENDEEMEEE